MMSLSKSKEPTVSRQIYMLFNECFMTKDWHPHGLLQYDLKSRGILNKLSELYRNYAIYRCSKQHLIFRYNKLEFSNVYQDIINPFCGIG